jgi:hypothetical protein
MAAAAVAADVAATAVSVDKDDDSCIVSFDDLENKPWPASLRRGRFVSRCSAQNL